MLQAHDFVVRRVQTCERKSVPITSPWVELPDRLADDHAARGRLLRGSKHQLCRGQNLLDRRMWHECFRRIGASG